MLDEIIKKMIRELAFESLQVNELARSKATDIIAQAFKM